MLLEAGDWHAVRDGDAKRGRPHRQTESCTAEARAERGRERAEPKLNNRRVDVDTGTNAAARARRGVKAFSQQAREAAGKETGRKQTRAGESRQLWAEGRCCYGGKHSWRRAIQLVGEGAREGRIDGGGGGLVVLVAGADAEDVPSSILASFGGGVRFVGMGRGQVRAGVVRTAPRRAAFKLAPSGPNRATLSRRPAHPGPLGSLSPAVRTNGAHPTKYIP